MAAKVLRPDQEELIDKIRNSLRQGHKRIMAQAPTGSGKTVLASFMIRSAYNKGLSSIFVVPSISLIDQTIDRLAEDEFLDVGVMQAMHELTDCTRPVQVASFQTLMRRQIPKAGMVIIDEAHRHTAFYTKWMNDPEWKDIPFIGFSATPWTRGVGKHYTDLVFGQRMGKMIKDGKLSPFRVFASSHPDLTGVRIERGDYREDDLSKAMSKGGLVADIVENWVNHGEGRPTLCFCVDRAHAKLVQEQFKAVGVDAGYIDAFTEKEERRNIQDQFSEGELQVVCNVGVLTTGVDWDVRCVIMARPTQSLMLFVQIIGRGLRTADGKQDCIIFDHSDNHLRMGFVTDIHKDHLDDGTAKEKKTREPEEPLPKECPKCHFIRPPKIPICPQCGFKPEVKSKVECEDGDLFEITRGKKPPKFSQSDKQRWYSMLMHHQQEKGYKPGWTANKFKDKIGEWPKHLEEIPTEPDIEVRGYIRHLNIKSVYAKKKNQVKPS